MQEEELLDTQKGNVVSHHLPCHRHGLTIHNKANPVTHLVLGKLYKSPVRVDGDQRLHGFITCAPSQHV